MPPIAASSVEKARLRFCANQPSTRRVSSMTSGPMPSPGVSRICTTCHLRIRARRSAVSGPRPSLRWTSCARPVFERHAVGVVDQLLDGAAGAPGIREHVGGEMRHRGIELGIGHAEIREAHRLGLAARNRCARVNDISSALARPMRRGRRWLTGPTPAPDPICRACRRTWRSRRR